MALFPTQSPAFDSVYAEEAAMVEAAEAIAVALEHAGITRAELAERLGVSRAEITHRLQGERNITVRKLAATLHALGAELHIAAVTPRAQADAERVPAGSRPGAPAGPHGHTGTQAHSQRAERNGRRKRAQPHRRAS